MKTLFLTPVLIGLLIAGGYYADAQFSSPADSALSKSANIVQLSDDTPPWLAPNNGYGPSVTYGPPPRQGDGSTPSAEGDPKPGSMEWLKIHYPEAYAAALQGEKEKEKKAAQQKATAAADKARYQYDRSRFQPALVLLEGDNGSGTAFICKVRDIPFLVTNIHMLGCADAADSYGNGLDRIRAKTLDGQTLNLLSIYGAEDHDLCIMRFAEEADYTDIALEFEANTGNAVQVGDPVVIPGNSKGGGTMVWTEGNVVGVGPTKIEHDAPVYEGNSGSPIIHIPSGKVIGVLSYAEQVPIESYFDETSFKNKGSAIKSKVRYYGYRLDSATNWYAIDLPRFCKQNDEINAFSLQRQNVAVFLYTDENDWRDDQQLMEIIDDANEQARRKVISGTIGNDSLRQVYATLFRQLDGLIRNDTYRTYQRHLRALKSTGGPKLTLYYPYFNEIIEREVKIRDYLSKNIQDSEKRVRK
jgi:hypothetical protein